MLGIDAAWSEPNPSRVALIRQLRDGRWEYVAAAPSYESFLQLAEGNDVVWEATPVGGLPDPERLLEAGATLLGDASVTVVSVDMPVSNQPIAGRRWCDNAIASAFWKEYCGTHTPNKNSPGTVSKDLAVSLKRLGYSLATCVQDLVNQDPPTPTTIEVYPHPAIVRLLNLERRLEYKVRRAQMAGPKAY